LKTDGANGNRVDSVYTTIHAIVKL